MEERKVPARKHAVPPIMIHSGTPCPPESRSGISLSSSFALPQINQHRNVVGSGHFVQQHADDLYTFRQDQGLYNSVYSFSGPAHMRSKLQGPAGSNVQLLQLPGCGGGGTPRYSPQSPSLSDVSSVRLTPRSPLSRLSLVDPPKMPGSKTPQPRLSLPPLYNLGYNLGGSNVDLEETNPSPLIPPLHSLSPYLNAGIGEVPSLPSIISPLHSAHHLSRKRALSSSPLSDLLDFNTLIRSSPNSLVAIINNSPYPYQPAASPNTPAPQQGSIGHLTVQQTLSPSSSSSGISSQMPGSGQYTVQRRKTSIEHEHHSNGTITTITNQITIHKPQDSGVDDSSPNLAVQHAADVMEMDYDCLSCKSANPPSVPQPQTQELNDPLVCLWNNCGKMFDEQDELVQHIEAHHIEKGKVDVFTCQWQLCPRNKKPFNARYKLLIHMRIHSGEKPNKCTYAGCTKAFSRLENLKIHLRTHTGEKPYVCQYNGCNKSFSNSSDRSKHQKTHYDQKPYTCNFPGCNKRYTDPSSLRKHCKIHLQHQRKKPRNESEDGGGEENLDCCLTIQPLACNASSPKAVPKLEGGVENKPPKPIKARNSKTHSKSPNPNGNVILPSPQDARQDFAPPSVDYFNPVPNSYPTSSHCHLQPPPSPRTMYIHSPMVPSPENHHNLHLPSPNTTQYHAHSPSSYQVIPPARAISMHSPGGSSGGRGGGGGAPIAHTVPCRWSYPPCSPYTAPTCTAWPPSRSNRAPTSSLSSTVGMGTLSCNSSST
ncbi:hypothetical protein EMCRGX_G019175 [Ephydatia muelleri]